MLESHPILVYNSQMNVVPDNTPPADWVEALDRGLADIEAGKVVPMEPVLNRGRSLLARLEAQLQGRDKGVARKA